MRRIVLLASISVDGFLEGLDRSIDWHLVDAELHRDLNEVIAPMSAFLSGRVMHEMMAKFWPTADHDPDSTPEMVEYAAIWRDKPKVVYSRTLQHADWNATVVRDVVPEQVERLKAQEGTDMVVGGGVLGAEFQRLDLVDEYRLYVHPIVLGEGHALFPERERRVPLRLVESRVFGNGVVLLRYVRRLGDVGATGPLA